jgi:hypothetical protein
MLQTESTSEEDEKLCPSDSMSQLVLPDLHAPPSARRAPSSAAASNLTAGGPTPAHYFQVLKQAKTIHSDSTHSAHEFLFELFECKVRSQSLYAKLS